jgi:Na+/H+ antiporter NhaD/arsenite permease-like protein
MIAMVYRREFRKAELLPLVEHHATRVNRFLLWKSLAVAILMVVFFFAGWPVSKVAVIAGALLLITRRVKPEKVYREIDWGLLVLFIGRSSSSRGWRRPACRRIFSPRPRVTTWNAPFR